MKILHSTENKALFLGIILISGTIFSMFILFTEKVQAESYYAIDNSYKPRYSADRYENYKDSGIVEKKIKCSNINLNINGISDEIINKPPISIKEEKYGQKLNDLSGNNNVERNQYGLKQNEGDSAFTCINNNNNYLQENKPNENEKPLTCEECFNESLTKEQLDKVSIATLFLSEGELSFEEVCDILADKAIDEFLTNEDKLIVFNVIFNRANISSKVSSTIITCLEELGIIKLA